MCSPIDTPQDSFSCDKILESQIAIWGYLGLRYHSFTQPCQANRMWPSLSNRYLHTIHDHLATRFEIMLSWQNKKSLNDFCCFAEQSRQIWTYNVLLLTLCQLGTVASISSLSSTKSYFSKYPISYVECSAVDKTPLNKTWANRLCSDLGLLPRYPVHWHPRDTDKISIFDSDVSTNTFLASFFQLWR